MFRAALLALPLVATQLAIAAPATASAAAASAQRSRTGEDCQQQNQRRRSRGRGIGGMFGSVLGGRLGGVGGVVSSVLPVGELLGEAVASLLDCREQQQAAAATEEAVRGNVGTTATWQSETRENVSGSSTVTAAEPTASNGAQCLTVTDIVIIDGEETRAPKRMCRTPPSNRYVRV